MKQSENQQEAPHIDYDGRWKRIIEVFFEPMTGFFMPELAADIDFSKPPEFLEQELAKIMPEQTAKGRMSIDKLLKVSMKNGEYEHIYFHVEVESQRKPNFPEKNFKYFYRIFDSKGKAITSLVIYASDDVPKPHDRYVYNFRGTELIYKFNTYLVRDANEEELLKSDNIFALVILTCKYINRTKGDFELRQRFKIKLFRMALERNYPKEHVKELINFINILVYLPPEIKHEFEGKVTQEFNQINMVEDQYIVLDRDEALELRALMEIREKFDTLESKVEEQRKAAEEQRKAAEEQRKAAEEQRKARTESIRKLLILGTFNSPDIADIMGVTVEEVLKIKAEIDAQS